MPTYEYRCFESHWTDEFRHYGDRDDSGICACGSPTLRGIQGKKGLPKQVVTSGGVVMRNSRPTGRRDPETGKHYLHRDHVCAECDYREDVVDVWLMDDGSVPKPPPCPECGSACRYDGYGGISRTSEFFTAGPVFDPGMGVWHKTQRDWRYEMDKRELKQIHGSMDGHIDRIERKQSEERRRDDKAYEDMIEKDYRHSKSPAMRKAFRQMEDEQNTRDGKIAI